MEATPEGKNAWTEQAKYQFLLHIISQLKEGKSIKWELINIPGRTTKSLQHIWTKINKEVQELEKDGGNPTPVKSSASKPRGRPKKAKQIAADEAVDDEYTSIPFKLAKKRHSTEDGLLDLKRMKTEEDNEFAQAIKGEDNDLEDLFQDE